MKFVCGLLLVCVVLVGCKPVEYQIQDNQIRVTGVSEDDIAQIVQKTFNNNHWTGTRSEYSSKVVQTDSGRSSSVLHKLSTMTEEGKPLSIEILQETEQPVLVTIHSAPDSRYTAQFLIQQLLDEIDTPEVSVSKTPVIRIDNLTPGADGASYQGIWTAKGNWKSPTPFITIQLHQDEQVTHYTLDRRTITDLNTESIDSRSLPQNFSVTTLAGTMRFSGTPRLEESAVLSGTVILEVDTQYRQAIQSCVKEDISDRQFLGLFFYPLDTAYAQQVVKAMGSKQSLSDLQRLRNFQINPAFIEKVYTAGYPYDADQLIRAKNFQLAPEFMAEFKDAGYDFSLDELIRVKNFQLNAAAFKTFKDAGYEFSIDDQIRAKNFQISPESAAQFKKLGCDFSLDELIRLKNFQLTPDYVGAFKTLGCDYSIDDLIRLKNFQLTSEYIGAFKKAKCDYSIDELIRLKNFQITPDYIEAFQKIGYKLSIDDMIKARNFQIQPRDLSKYADAGYRFTLDEVIKLRHYSVPMDFILAVRQEGYENFTAEELIKFRQKNISAEEIRKIRREKKSPPAEQPAQ